MQDFSIEGGPPNVCGVRFFEGGTKFFSWVKALKFGVMFQKFAVKLIKICNIIGKIREKCKVFGKRF